MYQEILVTAVPVYIHGIEKYVLQPPSGIIGSSFIAGPMHAASAIGEFANVVVLVRFNGDTQGDNGTGFNKPYNSTITNAPRT